MQYGAFLGVLTAIGAILGMIFVNKMMKKFDRQSIIVILLCFILLFCTLLIPSFGIFKLLERVDSGEVGLGDFGNIC